MFTLEFYFIQLSFALIAFFRAISSAVPKPQVYKKIILFEKY